MTYSLDYSRKTSTENPTELRIWNLAALQASNGKPFSFAMAGISPGNSCHVANAYKVVAKAVAAGLLVTEDDVENHCYNAGLKGESLEVTLESVGYWIHDTGEAYWRQGWRDAYADLATPPEYMAIDLIRARVFITVENLGFDSVSVRCDSFDRLYTVAAWDKAKKRPVIIAPSVLLDDILIMVDAWAIETVSHREMSRSLRVLNGFDEQLAA